MKKNLFFFILLFSSSCSMEQRLVPKSTRLGENRSASLQDLIDGLSKGKKPLSKKYVPITDVNPSQSGLFAILQSHDAPQITFITSFPAGQEEIQQYIDQLAQIEFIIEGTDNAGKPTFIFNLVDIEKLILGQQRKSLDKLFEFTDKHGKLTQQIDFLKSHFKETSSGVLEKMQNFNELLEEIALEKQALADHVQKLIQEKDQLEQQKDQLICDKKDIAQEKEQAVQESERLSRERDQLSQEKDALTKDKEVLEGSENLLQQQLVTSQRQTVFVGIGAVFATLGLKWLYNHFTQ